MQLNVNLGIEMSLTFIDFQLPWFHITSTDQVSNILLKGNSSLIKLFL